MGQNIPQVIHYCWFGGNPLPELAKKCIASWKKHLPGYEIKQWDETNFDIQSIPYTAEAYEAKNTPLSAIMPVFGFYTITEDYTLTLMLKS